MCGVWLKFIKNQEPIGLLSNLGLKRPCRKIHLLGDILFQGYKINETVSNLLLAGNKFNSCYKFIAVPVAHLLKTKKE